MSLYSYSKVERQQMQSKILCVVLRGGGRGRGKGKGKGKGRKKGRGEGEGREGSTNLSIIDGLKELPCSCGIS